MIWILYWVISRFFYDYRHILNHFTLIQLKGTVTVISNMTLYAKMAMSDLQRYPWNLNLIKNMKDNGVFLTRKVFIYVMFSIASHNREMCDSFLQRIHKWKKNSLFKQKHRYLIHTWSDKATLVNRALPSFYRGSLEITLTIPLTQHFFSDKKYKRKD